jgi:hypothetical protein
LFALAFQLAVSFGHVHVDAKGLGHSPTLADVHASTSADNASLGANDETAPALADDYCAVCALIHIAGTVVASQAPELPVPAQFGATQSDPPLEIGLTARSHALFAARAPPTA